MSQKAEIGCGCGEQLLLDPCAIVIFGASGDLTARKLIPALYALYCQGSLPDHFVIVGASRTELSDAAFHKRLHDFIARSRNDLGQWSEFVARIRYFTLQYESQESYSALGVFLEELDAHYETESNRLFYLATPPTLYAPIAELLGKSRLSRRRASDSGWTRLVVEKPFGRDLESARRLDRTIHKSFTENQVFRIDHYLAKETVQNILMLRFANTIFEPIWNRSYIQYVGIVAGEQLGVEHRAGYYEEAGVLRDMFQNHMMQLLALTSMEAPSLLESGRVRDEKAKVFRALKPFVQGEGNIVLGQYGPGEIKGQQVPGYLDEPGVAARSCTPTFAAMRLFVDNWRWKGVPFYLASGKRLKEKVTKIVVQFREVPHSLFEGVLAENITANRLVIGIYPQEKISLRFEAKGQGARICLEPVNMEFFYRKDKNISFDSYEKVLLDCILGDHMLFWRQDAVELSWSFLAPILEECEKCADRQGLLQPYAAGGWGPSGAREWMDLIMADEYSE